MSMRNFFSPALFVLILLPVMANGQDVNDFLRCGELENRLDRVLCLESALDAAGSAPAANAESSGNTVADFGTASGTENASREDEEEGRRGWLRMPRLPNIFNRNRDEAEEVYQPASVAESDTTTGADRLEQFGRETTRVVVNEDGQDELIDVISELEEVGPNVWEVTLASGQVWRQMHPRRYNLRAGQTVRIYPTGWGENFRLETERLAGFIQVARIK